MDDARRVARIPAGYRIGPWRVVEPLADGSWSSVYLVVEQAQASAEARRAALKVVPTGTLTPRQVANLAGMVDRELAAHRELTHPHLIQMLDVLVVDDPAEPALDGATAIVLELAARSAAQALVEAGADGLPEAGRLITEVGAGLAYLHGRGWVHGDVKPANILLMPDGSAVGRFRAVRRAHRHARLSAAGRHHRLHAAGALGRGAPGEGRRGPADRGRLGARGDRLPAAHRPDAVSRRHRAGPVQRRDRVGRAGPGRAEPARIAEPVVAGFCDRLPGPGPRQPAGAHRVPDLPSAHHGGPRQNRQNSPVQPHWTFDDHSGCRQALVSTP